MHKQILALRAAIAAFSTMTPDQIKHFDEATEDTHDPNED